MVVRIRLQRFGRTHLPFYRIVAADSRFKRDGRFLERLGTYNPIPTKDNFKEITADSVRIQYWLSVGAQPSDRVKWILGIVGLLPAAPVRNSEKSLLPKELLKQKK